MELSNTADLARTQDVQRIGDRLEFNPDKLIEPEVLVSGDHAATSMFDVDKLIEPEAGEVRQSDTLDGFNADRLLDIDEAASSDTRSLENVIEGMEERKMLSTEAERMGYVPLQESSLGHFEGERGNSKFIPHDAETKATLEKYGTDGIEYRSGIPDFSSCAEASVTIDDMTSKRYDNFVQADTACAKQWNEARRDGREDWTPQEVREWRRDNEYSWHECSDMKTCHLVPQVVHGECIHSGGVSECKKYEGNAGGFDD